MKLSQRRADSIRSYLVDKFGIAPERIKAVGYGPTKPVASNKARAGKEQNRRIESPVPCIFVQVLGGIAGAAVLYMIASGCVWLSVGSNWIRLKPPRCPQRH